MDKVNAVQTKVNQAEALLQNKENNSALVNAKQQLQNAVNQVPSTTGMTQESINVYRAKQQAAQNEIQEAQNVINNGDATAQQIAAEKLKSIRLLQALNDAKSGLRANKEELQSAYNQLIQPADTNNKNLLQ